MEKQFKQAAEMYSWAYEEGCDCNLCKAWAAQMGSPGKVVAGSEYVTSTSAAANIAGPEEVTTKTKVWEWTIEKMSDPNCIQETLEERNERIWQAIKDAAQG